MPKLTASNKQLKEMIESLKSLQLAAVNVSCLWQEVDLNDTAAIDLYPFKEDFNEMKSDICRWVDASVEELQVVLNNRKELKVTGKSTENTGGGCMVTFLVIEGDDELKNIGINDECIIGYSTSYYDETAPELVSMWGAYSYEELRKYVPVDIAIECIKAYHEFLAKYDYENQLKL